MRAFDDGSSFVVTRNGRPVGELRPLRRDRFVDAMTVAEVFRHARPLTWHAVREDLDRHADQDPTPRG
jgi:antitoxin (DNA-binding transcriptional repressor) of toxin-antitoxin stability system